MTAWTRPQRLAQNMYAHSKEQQDLFVEGFVRGYQYRLRPAGVVVNAMAERLQLINKLPVRSVVEEPADAGLLAGLFFGFVDTHDLASLEEDLRKVIVVFGKKIRALSPFINAEVTKKIAQLLS